MDPEPIKFHTVHGANICLSDDATVAELKDVDSGLCFTDRPLGRSDIVVLKILSDLSAVRGANLRVGVTRQDPISLQRHLPPYLLTGFDSKNGFFGTGLLVYEDCVRLDKEIEIYFDDTSGSLMIRNVASQPKKLFSTFDMRGPMYMIFNLLECSRKVRIGTQPRPEIRTSGSLSDRESETSESYELEPAYFISISVGGFYAQPKIAGSLKNANPRMNFAFVDTLLRSGCTLIVELTKLIRFEPVQIVLTTEDAHKVYSTGFLPKLCETTYSLPMESEIPSPGDELAIRICRTGVVYISHKGRGWHRRMNVDEKLEYHVIFDMRNISVLTMRGIQINSEEIEEIAVVVPDEAPQETGDIGSSDKECIICLERTRAVVLIPCFHFAFCEDCGRALCRADSRCPVCRVNITEIKKIYSV